MMPYNSMQPMDPYHLTPYPIDLPIYNDRQTIPHPILLSATQIASNQVELVYDQPTDLRSATNVLNY